jgi:hypothetical protein
MKKVSVEVVRFPAYALSYLINGDSSGITEEDVTAIDAWWNEQVSALTEGQHLILDPADQADQYFTWHPAFGLACDVIDCNLVVLEPDEEARNDYLEK